MPAAQSAADSEIEKDLKLDGINESVLARAPEWTPAATVAGKPVMLTRVGVQEVSQAVPAPTPLTE